MICPKCGTQCKQYRGLGLGISEEAFYDTGEVKVCPKCEKKFVEYYCVFEVGKEFSHPRVMVEVEGSLRELSNKFLSVDDV